MIYDYVKTDILLSTGMITCTEITFKKFNLKVLMFFYSQILNLKSISYPRGIYKLNIVCIVLNRATFECNNCSSLSRFLTNTFEKDEC